MASSPSSSSVFFVILVLIIIAIVVETETAGAQKEKESVISLGSSLSPMSQSQPSSWQSASGKFAFGFYPQGNGGFAVGIWIVGGGSENENTTVWTANRDDPPVSSAATLNLTLGGKLVLRRSELEEDNKLINIANLSQSAASSASMLDSGNFVLYNKDFQVIWESFNFPTDTIVGGQNLSSGHQLFSSFSPTNQSTGKFRLNMQNDGNLVMYPINTLDTSIDAYWSAETWGTLNIGIYLYLNITGALLLINGTGTIIKQWPGTDSSSSYNNNNSTMTTIIYRATIDYDGNLRLYSHNQSKTSVEYWSTMLKLCDVKSYCGFNSYCTMNDNEPYCLCLPGTDLVDVNNKLSDCERNFSRKNCLGGGKENVTFFDGITAMEDLKWENIPYFQATFSKDECRMSCLEDCDCDAALFFESSEICAKHKLPLKYVKRQQSSSPTTTTSFFKVGKTSIKRKNGSGTDPDHPIVVVVTTNKKAGMLILGTSLGFATYSCLALAISGFYVFKLRVLKYKKLLETGTLGLTEDLTLRPYSYNELRRATNGFKEELGKGSFGAVYKGSVCKGKRLVAVKRLEKVVDEGEREFQAEMQVIGRTRHKNLVRLVGYCAEGLKRLLVYEFMSNGSLADLLFQAERRRFPDWTERVSIALDVARGLLYLHEECDAPIIHCDIKPQNILMDEFWTAKISDFGLAKLLMPDQTRTFTGVRGTRGYLAPEWHKNTPITVKVDTYCYGIVLLEIVCCRRNLEVNVSKPDEVVLSSWAYKCFAAGELNKLVMDGGEVDKKSLDNMVKVAFWCIQDEPSLRPSMKSVVLMLEGITDISVPPCPTTT